MKLQEYNSVGHNHYRQIVLKFIYSISINHRSDQLRFYKYYSVFQINIVGI